MTKIDIVSGFLGAGKTTLIKKLIGEVLKDTKVVLIENEFGEIGIDGGFLKDAGIEIKEMNSGCICCSLVGDFGASLKEVLVKYRPERIVIEPSGVGKLSDVVRAVKSVTEGGEVTLNSAVAVVDASKCRMYMKNFGEFFTNQIAYAGTILLSRTDRMSEEKIVKCVEMIREQNKTAEIITTPWELLTGEMILDTIEGTREFEKQLLKQVKAEHSHEGHEHGECSHEGHEHGECGHEGHEHRECSHEGHEHGECSHEGHEHGECSHEKHHHEGHTHVHGEGCTCGCQNHPEGHHHADEVFTSWGFETPSFYGKEEMEALLGELEDDKKYGYVLRAKGMLPSQEGVWIYFDYVPGEVSVRQGQPDITGKICVIGSGLKEENLKVLFQK